MWLAASLFVTALLSTQGECVKSRSVTPQHWKNIRHKWLTTLQPIPASSRRTGHESQRFGDATGLIL